MHAELVLVRERRTGGTNAYRLIDPKSMVPERLGSAGGPKWLSWSESTRAYVEMLSVPLAGSMKEVEGLETPLSPTDITDHCLAVSESEVAQLGRYL